MTLYELVQNYNNIKDLKDNESISKDLFNSALEDIQQELIEKVLNIIEYRKDILKEEKTSKLIELDEYIQYCLILANIDHIEINQYILEVIKPEESLGNQKESIKIKERLK